MLRYGPADPTIRLGATDCIRATLTPDGPGTVHLDWSADDLVVEAWGPGADWLRRRGSALAGLHAVGHQFIDGHPVVLRAQRNHPDVRFGASGTPYHELLAVVLGQRVTANEAVTQWRRLVLELGEPAPGPDATLRLPPAPTALSSRPMWWFHPLGIEQARARTLQTVAKHAPRLAEWSGLATEDARTRLTLLPGVGVWTAANVLTTSWGDPDAVAVGDYHLANTVVHALTGRPRGTDDEMLELLEPYRGQRGRVVRLLQLDGHRAPAFGPRRRIEPNATR